MGHGEVHTKSIFAPGPLTLCVLPLEVLKCLKLNSMDALTVASLLCVHSPDEDSCQKFVPFIGVRKEKDSMLESNPDMFSLIVD